MTRKEEIEQFANFVYSEDRLHNSTFVEGAEWADRTMIDKACEWLYNELEEISSDYLETLIDPEDLNKPCTVALGFCTPDQFVERFRKAMQNG